MDLDRVVLRKSITRQKEREREICEDVVRGKWRGGGALL